MLHSLTDTIAALATPPGEGGIAVVRISGENALAVAARGFRGKANLFLAPTHTAHYGLFADPDGNPLDEIVAVVYRAPHSYTGENVVELNCHGGSFVTRKILEAVNRYGCRPAEPGEFTKRAFLSGRIDLSQAEAVADLIRSKSDRAHNASLMQLEGGLSSLVGSIRNRLIKSMGLLELELDFAEEGLEFVEKPAVQKEIESSLEEIDKLLTGYETGRLYREGVKVVLTGLPNVGKSSLLNTLLMSERAIVTEIPGTTRDIIEENIVLEGYLFRLVDTAGVRQTEDRVERVGVDRAENEIRSADIVVLVFDASRGITEEDIRFSERVTKSLKKPETPVITVLNKIDLFKPGEPGVRTEETPGRFRSLRVSALTGQGMGDLTKNLVMAIDVHGIETLDAGPLVTNNRHREALSRAKQSLLLAGKSLESGQSGEFVAVDLRDALDRLGEILGVVTTDDILNSIFSNFCIGK